MAKFSCCQDGMIQEDVHEDFYWAGMKASHLLIQISSDAMPPPQEHPNCLTLSRRHVYVETRIYCTVVLLNDRFEIGSGHLNSRETATRLSTTALLILCQAYQSNTTGIGSQGSPASACSATEVACDDHTDSASLGLAPPLLTSGTEHVIEARSTGYITAR